jgi:hypothetical protein
MKEDYLWDKTGNDPEIESLENALKAFRYTETAAPELPSTVVPFSPFRKAPARSKPFRFTLAAAACLAFFAVVSGVWFQVSSERTVVRQEPAKVESPSNAATVSAEPEIEIAKDLVEKTEKANVKKSVILKQSSPRKIIRIRKTHLSIAPRTIAQNSRSRKPEVSLTREEQYAYDQLMLALSITSSKLKLVKDKVEGME